MTNPLSKVRIRAFEPLDLTKSENDRISNEVLNLTEKAWGKFPEKFLVEHVMEKSVWIVLAYDKERLIGYCAVSTRNIASRNVFYIEFTVIDPEYQGKRVGPKLTARALRRIILSSIIQLIYPGVEVMFLTPNVRALAKAVSNATFIYPNPYLADSKTGEIEPADNLTWEMAQELINKSDNPNRTIDREGLVLHDSYKETPWLVYKGDSIPWHRNDKVNIFAKRYLGYGNGEDREFIVRMRVDLWSVLKSVF